MATPPGAGAVAIIRISGAETKSILRLLFSDVRPTDHPREILVGRVAWKGETLDRVLTVYFAAPRSYTGEDMAEIHCHGGTLVSGRVLEAVLEAGAKPANPGEFTQRAFLNGKMDLTQAEAVMDVISARTPPALRAAEEQLAGALGKSMLALREQLLGLVANIEAWIDFPDEDIDPSTGGQFEKEVRGAIAVTENLLSTARTGRIHREGVRLVLCGAPNAGKSSLMNRLLGHERAIVAPTPGTTRDTLEEGASFGGILFRITDTAGLREVSDPVEAQGIDRASRAIASADIVIRVVDASLASQPQPKDAREIVAFNKVDLLSSNLTDFPRDVVPISCTTGQGIENLLDALINKAGGGPQISSAAAINARHQACLSHAREHLQEALDALSSRQSPEFIAPGLHLALDSIGEILGIADAEEILGAIFSRFCIGK